jgi:hypothetical protein
VGGGLLRPGDEDGRDQLLVLERSRAWPAIAPTELEVIRGMRRCLRLIREGRVPDENYAMACPPPAASVAGGSRE